MTNVGSVKSSAIAVTAYALALTVLASLLLLPFAPGSVSFFAAHAFAFCIASILVSLQRKYAWEKAGMPNAPPWRPSWDEPYPAWVFESTLFIHFVDFPMAALMAIKIFPSMDVLYTAATQTLSDMPDEVRYGSSTALEHCIFASHFGIFIADFIVNYNRPNLMYACHHICSMVLLWCGSLVGTIPGVLVLAFLTPIVEIGSMGYCTWVLWRTRDAYFCLMNGSNLLYFVFIVVIVLCMNEMTFFFGGLVAGGIGLIIGRSYILVVELYPRKKVE